MTTKLFVGNLPFQATNADLEDLFSQVGAVASVNLITDKFTGRSRGFGFVEMASEEEATKAVEATNGIDFNGRNIVVNEARPETPRDRGGFGGGGGGGGGGRGRGGFGGGGRRSERW